ncbi:MAG TPA: hypothetical protein VNC22_09180, partial [Sporichthya sp.]|nr:hypothetical protein [Sporichthya sp.]
MTEISPSKRWRRPATLLTALGLLAVPTAYASGAIPGSGSDGAMTATSTGLALSPATGGMDIPVTF